MYGSLNHIISEINNKIEMNYRDMYKLYDSYFDKIYMTNDKLKEIMIQLKQKLKKILVQQSNVLQDFGEYTYSKKNK